MDSKVRNFIYRNPQFYELVYPEPNDETPMMCRRMFSRFLGKPPRSILDIGCGTGRDLNSLSRDCSDCWGVDCLPQMIEFARAHRPNLHLQVGDMRSLRLGRTFDVVMCMGSVFMYALTNADVDRVLDTFAAHSHAGTLLILDINNAASYLGGEHFKPSSDLGQVHRSLPGRHSRRTVLTAAGNFWYGGARGALKDKALSRISVSIGCSFRRSLSDCWANEDLE